MADTIRAGRSDGRIAGDLDADATAALVVAASDGLQIQWLLDPEAIDVSRSLAVLERILPTE